VTEDRIVAPLAELGSETKPGSASDLPGDASAAGAADPATNPADPATNPADPATNPADPATNPADDGPAFRHEPGRHGLVGPFSGRQLAGAFVAVLGIAVLLLVVTTPLAKLGATAPGDPRPTAYVLSREPVAGLKPGDLAPPLQVPTADGATYQLTDLQGRPVDLTSLRGRVVWLNFWASWCPPCQAETPVLRDMAARYQDQGLTIVGISVQETSEADVQAYADRYGLDYVVAADLQGVIFHEYKVYALPTQFFIDPTGVIRQVVQGPMDEATAISIVEPLLPAASPSPGATGP
jgi:cytochrome c biogenesis protein CcmG/thiol:disulfide interchange protein DsbE